VTQTIRQQAANVTGAFLLYAGFVVWLTWPLAVHVTTHLPRTHPACGFDPLHMAWTLSYETHALTTAPTGFSEAKISSRTAVSCGTRAGTGSRMQRWWICE